MKEYQIAVIGLGVHGAALCAELGRRGVSTLGVDIFAPPHGNGASRGGSRLWRETAIEDVALVPLGRRARALWEEYDRQAETSILVRGHGFAIIGEPGTSSQQHHNVDALLQRAQDIAETCDISSSFESGAEFCERFPSLNLMPRAAVFFEPGAFVIRPEDAVRVLLDKAQMLPTVDILTNVRATNAHESASGVEFLVGTEKVRASALVLATGAAGQRAILGNDLEFTVVPQSVLRVRTDSSVVTDLPSFVHLRKDHRLFYAVPASDGLAEFKFGIEADDNSMPVAVEEILQRGSELLPQVQMRGGDLEQCPYVVTRDRRLKAIRLSGQERIWTVLACNGYGFKYAPAIAELLADVILAPGSPPSQVDFAHTNTG